MKLIIAEKPSVAFAIAKALNIKGSKDGYIENKDFIISWCVGHLVALAEPSVYDEKYAKWNYADLPIIPAEFQYKIYGGKQKQFKVVKSLMNRKDVTEVVNACDAGREGELIFRLVYAQANCKKPVKRLWISSMEESAIREGFQNLKDGSKYDNLYQSALCRLWADWLVGINATRLFSLLYRKTLNIGRVQTPTLALLCDRHNKISFFKKEKYFTVSLDLGGVKAETQIHTHMCYSEFTDIIPAIDSMDADVITFEASRSDLQILDALKANNFRTEVGPGVYDIHSPRVPSVDEIKTALKKMLKKIPAEKLWVNPDCGLKTRGVEETVPSLEHLVEAAKQLRNENL